MASKFESTLGKHILVVDDQIGVVGSLQQKSFLRNYGELPYVFVFETCLVQDARYEASRALVAVDREQDVDLVLLDLKFGPDDGLLGLEILRLLTQRYAGLPVLVMSSVDRDVELLGKCLEEGAMGFVEKHKSAEYLHTAIERALSLMQSHVLLGQSEPLRDLRRQAARLSPYDEIPVLILGERGTGKERVARYIHQNGPRRQGPFVAVNCGGVPENLFESEFFGAEVGAFTGASRRLIGRLERAHGGTLFLDEVGTLPPTMQIKLLRVLQERTFCRLGGESEELTSNFQLLSATNADPQKLIREGLLREDFWDRIAAVTIQTPPLRLCIDDLPLLAGHFLERMAGGNRTISPQAFKALQKYDWPGNVRELQRAIQEALVRSEGAATLDPVHFSPRYVQGRASRQAAVPDQASTALDPARERLRLELALALAVKRDVQTQKGTQWRAEFMRRLFPHSKALSAKGFNDLIRRLTQGPWGDPHLRKDPELGPMLAALEDTEYTS